MRSLSWLFVLLCTLLGKFSFGQEFSLEPIKKGEIVPDVHFQYFIGDSMSTSKFRDLSGRYILFDFWHIRCASCIAKFPYLHDLQKKFRGKLSVFLVTSDDKEEINRAFNKYKQNPKLRAYVEAGLQLPMILGDSIFNALFPHDVIPTHVWIDNKQRLKSISYAPSTTEENVAALLSNGAPKFEEQRLVNIDLENPLSWLQMESELSTQINYYSFLMDHIEFGKGYSSKLKFYLDEVTGDTNGISCVNMDLLSLYKTCYRSFALSIGSYTIPNSRILINAHGKIEVLERNNRFKQASRYCYALKVPGGMAQNLLKVMSEDIDRLFQFKSEIKEAKTVCWVLEKIGKRDKVISNHSTEKYEVRQGKVVIHNMPFEQLINYLITFVNHSDGACPLIDKTNYKLEKVDVELPYSESWDDITQAQLNKTLRKYGLVLRKKSQKIKMLVLQDMGNAPSNY